MTTALELLLSFDQNTTNQRKTFSPMHIASVTEYYDSDLTLRIRIDALAR